MNKEEIIELLEEYNKETKEYLEEWLKNDEEAQEHYPTIDDYDNVISSLGEMFYVKIYDLAVYNLSKSLLNKLKK